MFTITREIGVDYGHRVMTHGSKCKNIHGHRGKIEVTCAGQSLHETGEQQDMVLDFGFLKEVMMDVVDKAIDHGFVACVNDLSIMKTFVLGWDIKDFCEKEGTSDGPFIQDIINNSIKEKGYWLSTEDNSFDVFGKLGATLENTKLYVVDFIPTSERLAEHFFNRLIQPVSDRSNGLAKIVNLRFWETPNCASDYPGLQSNT